MSKRGHEAPLNDNRDPASLRSAEADTQLSLGDEPLQPEPGPAEVPPALRLTPSEQRRADMLVDTQGLDPNTAAFWATSRRKAERILGHRIASGKAKEYEQGSKERKAK